MEKDNSKGFITGVSDHVGGNEIRPGRVRWADASWSPQRSPCLSLLNRRSGYTTRANASGRKRRHQAASFLHNERKMWPSYNLRPDAADENTIRENVWCKITHNSCLMLLSTTDLRQNKMKLWLNRLRGNTSTWAWIIFDILGRWNASILLHYEGLVSRNTGAFCLFFQISQGANTQPAWKSRSASELTVVCGFRDKLPAVHHSGVGVGSARWIGLQSLDLLYHLKAGDDDAKDDVDSAPRESRLKYSEFNDDEWCDDILWCQ